MQSGNTPKPATPAASTTVTERNLHCTKCGYNLYGIAERGVFPECGTFVWWTRQQLLPRRPKATGGHHYAISLGLLAVGIYVFAFIVLAFSGAGESAGYILMALSLPLLLLARIFTSEPLPELWLLLLFYVGNPLLYALAGATIGHFMDVSAHRSRR